MILSEIQICCERYSDLIVKRGSSQKLVCRGSQVLVDFLIIVDRNVVRTFMIPLCVYFSENIV